MKCLIIFSAVCTALALPLALQGADARNCADVAVYGSSPAALTAAIESRRHGKSAIVVCPERRIGGLTTGGLGQTDIGSKSAFGGLATEVLEPMDSRGPAFLWEGASIPCVSMLSRVSGASPLLVGWGQPEDAIHSPNESFSIRQFDLASMWGERILGALAPEKKGINR